MAQATRESKATRAGHAGTAAGTAAGTVAETDAVEVAAPGNRPSRLLTVKQVLEVVPVSRSSLYQHLLSGALPSVRVGRRRLVPQVWLDEWQERHTHWRRGSFSMRGRIVELPAASEERDA